MASGEHRVIDDEPTIADVCGKCNNGPLSVLDSYVCALFDKYFIAPVRAGDRVVFDFDFDLLLRWLLKVVFNHARARKGKWPVATLARFREFILGNQTIRPKCKLLLQLIRPAAVAAGSVADSPSLTEDPLIFSRIGLVDSDRLPGFLLGALITIRSYYFYLLLEDDLAGLKLRRRIFGECIKELPGSYELLPGKRAVVYSSSLDSFQMAERSPALVRNILKWNSWRT